MSHAFSNIENLTQQNTFFASAAMELEKPEYFLEYHFVFMLVPMLFQSKGGGYYTKNNDFFLFWLIFLNENLLYCQQSEICKKNFFTMLGF